VKPRRSSAKGAKGAESTIARKRGMPLAASSLHMAITVDGSSITLGGCPEHSSDGKGVLVLTSVLARRAADS